MSEIKSHEALDQYDSHKENVLERVRSSGAVTITPEVFESMFLAPKMSVKGDLRNTFANPTPVALGGFLLCTTPLSMVLLGWRGAGGLGAAEVGNYFFLGGLLLTLGGIGEFLLGNTFPEVVFLTFGGFWFSFGAMLVPSFNAYGAYSTTGVVADGLQAPAFANSFAFFLVAMNILCGVFLIASVRTNVIFFLIFLLLVPTFSCLSAAFYALGEGLMEPAMKLQHAGAALLLVVSLLGWYIFLSLVLYAVDFPFVLPLGDLSTKIKGYSQKKKVQKEKV